ncbi:hypothetical protein D1646_15500 [Pseudoflavonifractor sp. 60]|uniref:flagellin lysine-N-methylase n=1 Tax=Pseudoflavonifractor sp. 60 TaxID=2304576 RepID=UPI001367EE48|nr:flagellin lysine-N-methylase [Pseudoflavonifractor sp. 60]NBI68185.1 hypothetical protein [Pseudoflavonifractor sp. 60]
MSEKSILICTALMPACYKDFHCIMGDCQDTCCANWRIEFSKKDYLAIKRAPKSEELEKLLEKGMKRLREAEHGKMYAEFPDSQHGRCAFHTPEGLCRLQLECGADTLPMVCRTYPRHSGYTTAALEYALSPSCEGVLALLWDLEEGLDFIEEPLPPEDHRRFNPDHAMEARFAPLRELWIDTLQTRTLPLSQRMLLLGLMTQQLGALDWQDGSALDRAFLRWRALLQDPTPLTEGLEKLSGNRQMFMLHNLHLLFNLAQNWGQLATELLASVIGDTPLEQLDMNRVTINAGHYQELEDQLTQLLGGSEHFMENLMVNDAFYLALPSVETPEKLWTSYVNLCNLYSFYRFTAVCSMDKEVSRARLFHTLVHTSRSLIHNPSQRTQLRDELFKNDSATLAHMAILVGG